MENNNNRRIQIVKDAEELAEEAARQFIAIGQAAIAAQGRFTVALSGGRTPRAMHAHLAAAPLCDQLEWSRVFVFWGDERCVPPDHPDSNYKMAEETLLSQVPIPPANVHRMRGEDDPTQAAADYGLILQNFFQLSQVGGPSPENYPRFDLVLLGMGPDGHTASLFPETAALQERSKPVTANYVPKLDSHRITLTSPSINRAANVLFLVEGEDKAQPLHEVLEGEYQSQVYPSQLIRPSQGQLTFLIDQAAANGLKKS